MTNKVTDLRDVRAARAEAIDHEMLDYFRSLPPTITGEQCLQGRKMLGWTIEALAFRSRASVKAITQFESDKRVLHDVTRQALAFALENEGLMLIPGHSPMRGSNCRGSTLDPRTRDDYHRIE